LCSIRQNPASAGVIDCQFMTARPIAEVLAGQRILVTGSTGFVGEALLERLLHDLPDTPVVLLVRARGALTAEDRIRHMLAGPAFVRLRERRGEDLGALLDGHITVIEGDLDEVPDLPDDLDIVIHCAGEVSFDPAIDEGFATNVHGTLNLLAAIDASGSQPHYVHVSTAYVAGRQQGHVREGRLDHTVDWRREAEVAAGLRERAEMESRSAAQLTRFTAEAEEEHGTSGALSVSAEAERRRQEWVSQTLIDAGRERGRSLGWTDCYTFTKAMAERAVEETAPHLPVTVLRPSIIESALRQPYPGWIEGFKMAEPIILAFGRGDLPDFPGIPDGVVDIIPVDLVVNAAIAAAAHRPEPGAPAYYTICSGARNPLSFRLLHDLVRDYFIAHPMVQRDRGEVRVPRWQWPGSERVDQLIKLGDRAHRTADRLVTSLPRSARTRDWARTLDRQRGRLDFLRRYFDLYRPYADAELHFSDRSTLELHQALHPDDVEPFGFDATVIDWRYYLVDVHVPAVVAPLNALSAMRGPRPTPTRSVSAGSADGRTVAVFDMDGTLLASNVVESYLWLRLPELAAPARAREVTEVARALPRWLATQRRDRASFLRMVYRRYEGASLAELERIVDEHITPTMLTRLSANAVRAIREHRNAGHYLVLVTGAVRPLTRPIAALFDEVAAADLSVDRFGRCTGHLDRPPLVGESRAAWLRHRALEAGWDLSAGYAYADSASDLPLLRAVGQPVVIDPDVVLSRVARKERWPVEIWHGGTTKARTLEPAR
jgi:alcohol-forming fatty acyl-CoA reductase